MKLRLMAALPESLRWVVGILAALILLALARQFINAGAGGDGVNPPLLVTVTEVRPSEIGAVVTFSGAIAARDEAAISAEGEGGRVSALYAEVGDVVKAGTLLAKLDTSLVAPQVVRLEASLQEAQANAAVAAADYRRAQEVAKIGALSAQEIERRQAAQVAAEATVKVAEAQLSEARARLARTEVRAPFDGIVLTRSAEVGQLASAGSAPLFRLGRSDGIEMRGNVAEQDLPQLAVGMPARVRVTGVEQFFDGRVRLIGAVIDPQTRLGSVRIELPLHPNLRPGAFARGEVETTRQTRALIPQTAVMTDDSVNFVFLVDGESRVQRQPIDVASSRPEGVVVNAGLSAGDRVVTLAGPYLRAGETVRVAE